MQTRDATLHTMKGRMVFQLVAVKTTQRIVDTTYHNHNATTIQHDMTHSIKQKITTLHNHNNNMTTHNTSHHTTLHNTTQD